MGGAGEEGGGVACSDDFFSGRINVSISLSLTASRQEAGLVGDFFLFIIILLYYFTIYSPITARQSRIM